MSPDQSELIGVFPAPGLDFPASDGFFDNGLKKPVFDGRKWIDLAECPKYADYEHVRMYGDFVYWLGKCIRWENEHGREHLLWQEVFRRKTNKMSAFSVEDT